jgi:hypothetical protein
VSREGLETVDGARGGPTALPRHALPIHKGMISLDQPLPTAEKVGVIAVTVVMALNLLLFA